MTLADLASLGGFVSGVAVVVTLVFLTLQLRQSAKATISSAMGTWLGDYNATLLRLSSDADLNLLVRRGLTDMQSLDINDQSRFHDFMSLIALNANYVFNQRKAGAFDPDIADNVLGFAASMLKMKGGRAWWELVRPIIESEFQHFMDTRIAAAVPASDTMRYFATEVADTSGPRTN